MRTLTHLLPPSSYCLPLLQSVFSSFIIPSASSSVRLLTLHRTVRLFFRPSSHSSSYRPPLLQSVFSPFIVPSSLPSAAFHSVHTLSSSLSPFLFRSGPFPSHLSKIPFQGTHIFNFPPCWQLQRYKSFGNDILVGCCLLSTLTHIPVSYRVQWDFHKTQTYDSYS